MTNPTAIYGLKELKAEFERNAKRYLWGIRCQLNDNRTNTVMRNGLLRDIRTVDAVISDVEKDDVQKAREQISSLREKWNSKISLYDLTARSYERHRLTRKDTKIYEQCKYYISKTDTILKAL